MSLQLGLMLSSRRSVHGSFSLSLLRSSYLQGVFSNGHCPLPTIHCPLPTAHSFSYIPSINLHPALCLWLDHRRAVAFAPLSARRGALLPPHAPCSCGAAARPRSPAARFLRSRRVAAPCIGQGGTGPEAECARDRRRCGSARSAVATAIRGRRSC